jgi:ABC-2 type transport system permease protein
MRAYGAVLGARFRTLLQYRAAAVAGFGTQLFWGLIRVMIFEAFYRSSTAPQPMAFPEVVTYLWLGQAFFALLPWAVDADVRAMIRTGTVAYELVRPLDLYALWYSRALAARLAPTLLRAVPMFVVAGLFFGMEPPPSLLSGAAWIVTGAGALLLSSAFSTLMTISLLWTVSGEGVSRLAPSLVLLFSGMLLPLPLFPDWAQSLLNFLPFRGLVDAPFRVYLGHIPPERLPFVFLHQAAWTVALVALGRFLLLRGTRRLVVQGG